MKKFLLLVLLLAIAGVGAGAYYRYYTQPKPPEVVTAPIARGDIVDTVGATGTLEAVTTVQVGTQVSGTIKDLYADFNSIVHQGQVIARLDPSLFQTQIDQARANLLRSEADVERLKVGVDDARSKLKRTTELSARNLVPAQDLEAAQLALRSAEAQLQSAQAQVTQARATLNQNDVNLQHTVIQAPIDGIVISRNVDVGQTVAASMQAPTLFVLAADLTKMKVTANVDEADVGRIRPGQHVRFRVDAYAADDFHGAVEQIRLQPVVVQNVVTYATVIAVPNADLRLKPGMTANVNIEVARRSGVLKVPNAAVRFRPSPEIFAALNQAVPPELQRGFGRPATGQPESGGPPAPSGATAGAGTGRAETAAGAAGQSTGAATPGGVPGTGDLRQAPTRAQGGEGGPSADQADRRQRFMARLEQLPPEERERALQRMRERGSDRPGSAPQAAAGRGPELPASRSPQPQGQWQQAQTIDALFGALPVVESQGRVWLYAGGQLKLVRVRLGITDGTYTELLGDSLQAGTEVVTAVTVDAGRSTSSGIGRSPLMGPTRGGPPPARNTGR